MKALLKLLSPFYLLTTLSAEEIKIATDEWEGYTSNNEKGLYIDILREIYPSPEYTLKFEFVPFKRSLNLFASQKVDILLAAGPEDIPRKNQSTYPVESDSIAAVVSQQTYNGWNGSASLKNKSVIARTGYSFDKYIPSSSQYSEVPSLKSMLLMLKRGRADALLDYPKDIQLLWDEAKLRDGFVMVPDFAKELVYFGFIDSRNDLKERFDAEFKKLYQSGKLSELFAKHNIPDDRQPKIDYSLDRAP